MNGELGGNLGQALPRRGFEGLGDAEMQPLAPQHGNLLVDHLVMECVGELVAPRGGAVAGRGGPRAQEQMRAHHLLGHGVDLLRVAIEGRATVACVSPMPESQRVSKSYALTIPCSSRPPRTSISWAAPFGSQPCSSARESCTRTGRRAARESSAASPAASSAQFLP
jgi:hypothetical protein